VKTLIWLLDELLDHLPRVEDGKWYWCGDWGCRLINWLKTSHGIDLRKYEFSDPR
jgi:hypothetical protein